MNKNIVVLIVLVAAIAGTLFVTQQREQAEQERQAQIQTLEETNRLSAEAQKAINEARRLEEIATKEAEARQLEILAKINEAQILLDSGEYQQAIDTSKNILGLDAENIAAKQIIETSMTRLNEIAQQQLNALTKQEPQKMVEESDLVPNAIEEPEAE